MEEGLKEVTPQRLELSKMGSDNGFHRKEGVMLSPEAYTAMQQLKRQGVGKKQVARLLGLHVHFHFLIAFPVCLKALPKSGPR